MGGNVPLHRDKHETHAVEGESSDGMEIKIVTDFG